MKITKKHPVIIFVLFACIVPHIPAAYPFKTSSNLFHHITVPFVDEKIITNQQRLSQLAKKTLKHFNSKKYPQRNSIINSQFFINQQAYRLHVQKTLRFLEKKLTTNKLTPAFLKKNFHCIKWNGNRIDAQKYGTKLPPGSIRLTKYVIYTAKGSTVKTKQFPYALYAIPHDEKKLSGEEIIKKKRTLTRFKYSKQEVLAGALESETHKGNVTPLVWLTRQHMEEALMQGTIIVELPDKTVRTYNFMKSNHMPYDRAKQPYVQKSYGYFKEVSRNQNFKEFDLSSILAIQPEVTFAGDIAHIGLGQFIAIRYSNPITRKREIRFGILADTGGAFRNNLYQLDYFSGIFPSRAAFRKYATRLPLFAEAYILVKK